MDPYIGEIRLFAGNYAPENWAICDGAQVAVNDYQALYALIGTTYGGNGTTSFALPDLRGRVPIGQGQAPNVTARTLGQIGGTEKVSLNVGQLPPHNHQILATSTAATTSTPGNSVASRSIFTGSIRSCEDGTDASPTKYGTEPAASIS